MLDTLNTQQIEQIMSAEQAKAKTSAAQPERFALCCLEVEVRTDQGNQLVMWNDGDWTCTCVFFEEWRTCCHTMAVALRLLDSLLPQPAKERNEAGPRWSNSSECVREQECLV